VDNVLEFLREGVEQRYARLRRKANPDCAICRGKGTSKGWVAQGYTEYACPCTGEADWQK
jgi:hypothetical protein